MNIIVFRLDEQQFAFDLSIIDKVIHMVELTPIPHAPRECIGAINMHGSIIPVLDLRLILGWKDKNIGINDHLAICHWEGQQIAIRVDSVVKVMNFDRASLVKPGEFLQNVEKLIGLFQDEGEIILMLNSETLFLDDLPLNKEA